MNMKIETLPATGERFMPDLDGVVRLEHLHRYRLACYVAEGLDVLDIASGEGYGSSLLVEVARSVIGVDIAQDAIDHAQAAYARVGLSFLQGSATAIPLPDSAVDLVVSFETIEHLQDHDGMMNEIRRVLREGGVLLISSPNKRIYSDRDGYANPFHQRELYTSEFLQLAQAYFANVALYAQKTTGASVIVASSANAPFVNFTDNGEVEGLMDHRYDLIVASNRALPVLPNSVYEIVGGPLQPEQSEVITTQLRNDFGKTVHEITRLTEENEHLRGDLDAQKDEHAALDELSRAKAALAQTALLRVVEDANQVLADKWWRRTRHLRRMSNSLRKLRGRPKKQWPKAFIAEDYLVGLGKGSSTGAAAHAQVAPRFVPSLAARCVPRLTVVAMARDEAARAHDTMRHFCALFDRVVLIDHLSADGTAHIARGYHGVAGTEVIVLRAEDAGYYQSEYMSAVANALLAEGQSDWIFFLDFDEFLPFENASDFRKALVDLSDQSVIHGHWINVALEGLGQASFQGVEGTVGPTVSDYVKIAVNARLLQDGPITVCQGNHAVVLPGQETPYTGKQGFGLFHVPIASRDALRRKVAQGTRALAETKGKSASLGSHWRDLNGHIDKLSVDADLMREVALNYGRPLDETLKAVSARKLTENIRPITLRFAQVETTAVAVDGTTEAFTLDTINDVLGARFVPEPAGNPLEQFATAIYAALPARPLPAPELGTGRERIEHALLASATDVEVVVPTAWQGHIPFLFALMETLRPRRYVELGTHAGASFFAACQHIRSNDDYGEAVAIDLWTGDRQAGFYKETVFENFKYLLNRHFPKNGKFIRGYFADAVSSFEDASIDLLHIDGLHTFDAVKQDYETWRPKLAENGVIIFHDTNEFQTDFGVWQFFEMVRSEAAKSFQFRHGHGLGVLAFGNAGANPAIEMLTHFNTRPERIESFFATLSKALYDAARFRMC